MLALSAADTLFRTVSSIDRALLEQAARLLARSERSAAADPTVRLSSESRRILAELRKRIPPPPQH
jgi:hypothetical protein